MSKFKVSHSCVSKKFSNSLNSTNERPEEKSSVEKYILQNPSDTVDDSRDQLEDLPEEEPEEDSSEELEEDPEEDLSEELEEDPEEDLEIDEKWRKVSDNEEKYNLQNPSDSVNDSRDQFEDLPEEDPEEDPDEDSSEELEEDPEEDPEIDEKWREVSGNEEKYNLQNPSDSFNDSRDQFEDLPEEDPEEESSEELEEDPEEDPEIDSKWEEVSGNEVPVLSQASLHQSQKRCNLEGLGSQKLELEPSRLEQAPIDKFASKVEGAGSSGKRRRSRWESQPDGDGIKEDEQYPKRRKTRWSSDEKMLGPLQLPDSTEDFVIEADKDPKIQRLKAELLEINAKLLRPPFDDRPEEERSPFPEPIYNNLGIRTNTREVRSRQKLVHKRQNIISMLIKLNPTFNHPSDFNPPKLFKKLYIPVKEYPDYNFVGLVLGPRGNTHKRMEKETGAKILLRGKGSLKTPSNSDPEEDLHVYIEANNQKSLDAAVGMVEKLLIPIEEGRNEHKLAQLKELAVLKGTLRDENVCSVCGDQGHRHYACPNLQSTFKLDSFDACCSNSLSTPAYPVTALFPQSDSVNGSGFSLTSMQNAQTRPGKEINDKHLYVGYLPQSIDENRLTELFSPFGKITEAKVVKDRTTGISRGFGFVTFIDSKDAAVAVAHLNGFKIDGKFLRVNIAGLQPKNDSPSLSLIPQNPGLAALSPNISSQTDRSGPLHFMLPEHQSSFHDSSGTTMFPSTINSEHGDPNKSLVFTPPGNTLNTPDFSYSSNMHHFSGNFSGQSLFSSDSSTTQFPCDPGNLGSQFQSYYMTPTFNTATLPSSYHSRERKI